MISIEITPLAETTFETVYCFLIELWNYKVANDFADLSNEAIKNLVKNPFLGKPYANETRIIFLHKNASMIYQFFENISQIQIVLYIDNRQNPESYLKLL